ncbi:hypothetical protein [Amycolatopsis sp. NPDC059657]|uniref:Rv1733c family protein n=1 Tax=Amycolatopsis sp. NPDC059657 TaxID=3346899 RepID=UPI0036709C3D
MNPLSWWMRLWRTVRHGANPLARLSDRLEGALIVLGLMLALFAFPCAAAVGSTVYRQQQEKAAEQLRTRTQADAVLLENGPSIVMVGRGGMSTDTAPTAATWTAQDGGYRTGDVPAGRGLLKGRTIKIWLDQQGNRADEPLTYGQAVSRGVGAGIGLWLGVLAALGLAYAAFRVVIGRINAAAWQREWWLTEQRWTRS